MKTPRPWCWSWVIVQDGCSGKSVFLKENQHRFCNSFYEAWPPAQVTRSRFFFQIRIVPIKRFSPTERCFLRSTLRFVFPTSYSLIQCCCFFFKRLGKTRVEFVFKPKRRVVSFFVNAIIFLCKFCYITSGPLLAGSAPVDQFQLRRFLFMSTLHHKITKPNWR